MLVILQAEPIPFISTDAPIAALNSLWLGHPPPTMTLPHIGHVFLICPLNEMLLSCSGQLIHPNQYMMVIDAAENDPIVLKRLDSQSDDGKLLILLLSSGFVEQMADFLSIPTDFNMLLNEMPLLQGDFLSKLLQQFTTVMDDREVVEEIFMDVVGQILQLLRLRYEALLALASHKDNTITDLLPRLLQARQFIAASYLDAIKTSDVANHILLSEYHFARLFKTAFDTTVHQTVMQLRLDEARRLLESSQESITDISLTVGYNSMSAFINAFRRQFKMTPSYYRNRFQQ